MQVHALTNCEIIRVISRAFQGLDTVRIEIENEIRLYGMNESSTVYYNLVASNPNPIKKVGVTVSNKLFNNLLEITNSTQITDFKRLILNINGEQFVDVELIGRNTKILEKIPQVITGITEEPSLIYNLDFSNSASCVIKSPSDYKLVYKFFEGLNSIYSNVEPLEISIKNGCIAFKPSGSANAEQVLMGECINDAISLINLPDLKLTSDVADLSIIDSLTIYIINNSAMKFVYDFNLPGSDQRDKTYLEYFVMKAVDPDSI